MKTRRRGCTQSAGTTGEVLIGRLSSNQNERRRIGVSVVISHMCGRKSNSNTHAGLESNPQPSGCEAQTTELRCFTERCSECKRHLYQVATVHVLPPIASSLGFRVSPKSSMERDLNQFFLHLIFFFGVEFGIHCCR